MLQSIQSLDTAILLFIQEHIRNGFLTPVMKAASFLGDNGLIWIALTVLLLLLPRTRRGGLDVCLSLAFATALNNLVLKKLIARPRPFLTIETLELIVAPLKSSSFPSGHACAAFAAAFALTRAFGKKGAWAYLPAALIALSRIYVGIHYPSDVLCGAVFGTVCALIACLLSRRFVRSDLLLPRERERKGKE